MLRRLLVAVLLICPMAKAWSVDVASIVACKADGETWLCAAYEDDSLQVFRSNHYISKVEFRGERGQKGSSTMGQSHSRSYNSKSVTPALPKEKMVSSVDRLPNAKYTLQLLACNAPVCRKRMANLAQIPGSQTVEIKNQGKLWEVLIVGGYGTPKTAQQAAANLISKHRLKDKPWVRTTESLRSRLVNQ
ncbi:MAG: hypothetical protein OQK12_00980 [Motiliproteus sp.]|nr:hypothetical protein [Motiliproteus sp.]MCW9052512.1 hypothetical protein [Motiliproteus sp.]